MLVELISKNYTDQLCDSCQEQVSVKRFFVPGFAPGKPEAVFDVIDGAFHGGSGFIGILPFSSPTQGAWVHPEVFLRIDVHHSPTGRRCTGIVTMADTVIFPGRSIFFPFDVWAAEFITGNAAFEFAGAFRFQRKGSIIGAEGNAVLVQGIILIFQPSAGIQRNIGLLKMDAIAIGICAKGIAGKKFLIKHDRIESGITEESFGIDERVGGKKIL